MRFVGDRKETRLENIRHRKSDFPPPQECRPNDKECVKWDPVHHAFILHDALEVPSQVHGRVPIKMLPYRAR